MTSDARRFTEQWDAVDPFDPSYPHLWVKAEHLGRYLFAAEYLKSQNPGAVLDIGCGSGYGSVELSRFAASVVALDVNLDDRRDKAGLHAHENVTVVRAEVGKDSLTHKLGRNQFDAIVCFEVIEHLIDPESALHEFSSLMNPGGKLIVSVPNSVAERTTSTGLLSNSYHRRMYSISSIIALLEQSGFQPLEVLDRFTQTLTVCHT